eukprot:2353791-Alexandrium_andersonii.AAC.1
MCDLCGRAFVCAPARAARECRCVRACASFTGWLIAFARSRTLQIRAVLHAYGSKASTGRP